MIDNIKFRFGASPSTPALSMDVMSVTVFVGPNNSGKSRALADIDEYCSRADGGKLIMSELIFSDLDDPEETIKLHTLEHPGNESSTHIHFGKGSQSQYVSKADLLKVFNDVNTHKARYSSLYLQWNTIRIGGDSRINLVNPLSGGDLRQAPLNHLAVLVKDKQKRLEIRRIIKDAFNKYFVIDPTHLGMLGIRLSDTEPVSEEQEIGILSDSIQFHNKASDIRYASDGVKAYTGIVTAVVAGDPKIILIDEPEAFLHPALAFSLGKEISSIVNKNSKRLFVSTHSSHFLMGCIQSGVALNIVRLTYSDGVPTARLLPKDKVLKLMRNPLLRSTGVLNGLFYEYVVITEADSDRSFYQEINERLLAENKGITNCLFLNAQNKQTIHEILRPLREMGIPCAAIVDVDVVKEGGTVWKSLLSAAGMSEASINALGVLRGNIKSAFDATLVDFKKNGGINVLNDNDKLGAADLFDQLDDYGIFTVRNGELESWLKDLKVTGHSPKWLIEVFEKLGEDPISTTYIKPGIDDVWEFMGRVKVWLSDTARKGIKF